MTEVLAGVATGMVQAAGAAIVEAPAVMATEAIASVGASVTETIGEAAISTAAQGVTNGAGALTSQIADTTFAATEAVSAVQETVGETLAVTSATEALTGGISAPSIGAQMESLLADGASTTDILTGLQEGLLVGEGPVPTNVLVEQTQAITGFTPEKLMETFDSVDKLDIPSEMYADMQFRQELTQSFFEEAQHAQGNVQDKQQVAQMMQKSAAVAKEGFAKRQGEKNPKKPDDKELEKLKKRAAIEAIKRQMMQWHQSVEKDKRLDKTAKAIAHEKVNRVEQRLVLQTQMQWDGKSLVKMMMVAAMSLRE